MPAPTTIEGLTQSFTTCATSSITLAYPAAAATYTGYTWSAISPANALGYLSANNVATPTFLYNGANITSPLVVTYKLTLKRYNGCEAVQTVTVQVSPQGINLTTPDPLVVNCKMLRQVSLSGSTLLQLPIPAEMRQVLLIITTL